MVLPLKSEAGIWLMYLVMRFRAGSPLHSTVPPVVSTMPPNFRVPT